MSDDPLAGVNVVPNNQVDLKKWMSSEDDPLAGVNVVPNSEYYGDKTPQQPPVDPNQEKYVDPNFWGGFNSPHGPIDWFSEAVTGGNQSRRIQDLTKVKGEKVDVDTGGLDAAGRFKANLHLDEPSQLKSLGETYGFDSEVMKVDDGVLAIKPKKGEQAGKWVTVEGIGADWGDIADMGGTAMATVGAILGSVVGRKTARLKFANRAALATGEAFGGVLGAGGGQGLMELYLQETGQKLEGSEAFWDNVNSAAMDEGAGQAFGVGFGASVWAAKVLAGGLSNFVPAGVGQALVDKIFTPLLPLDLIESIRDNGGVINRELFARINSELQEAGGTSMAPRASALLKSPFMRNLENQAMGTTDKQFRFFNELDKFNEEKVVEYAKLKAQQAHPHPASAPTENMGVEDTLAKSLNQNIVNETADQIQQMKSSVRKHENELEDIIGELPATGRFEPEVGERVQENIREKFKAAQDEMDAVYSSINERGGTMKYAMPDTRNALESAVEMFDNLPTGKVYDKQRSLFQSMLERLHVERQTPTGGRFSAPRHLKYFELTETLKTIRSLQREAVQTKRPSAHMDTLNNLEEAILQDRARRWEKNPDLAAAVVAADNQYKAFREKWKEGVLARLNTEMASGGQIKPEGVLSTVFGKTETKYTDAERFSEILRESGDFEALQNIRQAILGQFENAGNPQKWFADREKVLRLYLPSEQVDIMKKGGSIKATINELKRNQKDLNMIFDKRVLGDLRGSKRGTVHEAVANLNGVQMDELLSDLKKVSPSTVEDVKAMWLNKFQRSFLTYDPGLGTNTINTRKLAEHLSGDTRQGEVLNKLFPEYKESLKLANKVVEELRNKEHIAAQGSKAGALARLMVFGYLSHKSAIVRASGQMSQLVQEENVKRMMLNPERLIRAANRRGTEYMVRGVRQGAGIEQRNAAEKTRQKVGKSPATIKKLLGL